MQREGVPLPLGKGKCCSQGSPGGLLLRQTYAAAEPLSLLASVLVMGRKPELGGEGWGKRQCPRQERKLLETTRDSFYRDRPDTSLCPTAPVLVSCCCWAAGGDTDPVQKPLGTEPPLRRVPCWGSGLQQAPEGLSSALRCAVPPQTHAQVPQRLSPSARPSQENTMKPLPGAQGPGAELPAGGLTLAPSDTPRLGVDRLRTPCPDASRAGSDADNSLQPGRGARRVCGQILLCNSHLCTALPPRPTPLPASIPSMHVCASPQESAVKEWKAA